MPRPHNWYPSKIYDLLYRIGHDNNLSYQEVAFMFLREALLPYGFDCEHPINKIGKSPTDGQPYCKNCMSRLEEFEDQVLEQIRGSKFGRYRTVKVFRSKITFLDTRRKEDSKKAGVEYDTRLKTDVEAGIKAVIEDALRKEREKGTL